MKTIVLFGLASGLLLAAGGPVPRKATDFSVQIDAKTHIGLDQFPNKVIVFGFILTDCSHCEMVTKVLNGIQKDYLSKGVVVLGSVLDKMAAVRIPEFQRKMMGTAFQLGFNDPREAAFFLQYQQGVNLQMPIVVVVDRSRMIRAQMDAEDKRMLDIDKSLRSILDETLAPAHPADQKDKKTK
jgi:thiol-disulfide isomerase/thioredoxin